MAARYLSAVDLPNLYDALVVEGFPGEKRILVEGDSWASYPLPTTGNLACFVEVPEEMTVVLNLAWMGDQMIEMCQGRQYELFKKLIHDDRWGYKWDVLFLVGGGNDLVGWIFNAAIRNPGSPSSNPEDYVDRAALEEKLAELKSYFQRYIALRDESAINRATPIVVQTYDYVVPRDQPPTILGFPVAKRAWILPKYQERGILDPEMQKASLWILLDEMAAMLQGLAAEADNFHVADTRGTLAIVSPDYRRIDGDWRDEMHPSATGYRKLTGRHINPLIRSLVP
ncbi:MAG: hypothetical protein CVV05_17280 [Gammaproteobacteria bacterium HGW-Gammaproteobacteria-1]|jgi:hypothetical protein|nr:MAG: hypothetical protein CVV05_17280 [Gammaproteobacteria bacterium HGW-Gammaproteobacteria-1]